MEFYLLNAQIAGIVLKIRYKNKKAMKIQVFAALKDYFEMEFELMEDVKNVEALKKQLIALNASAVNILQVCRFAVGDEFVDHNFRFKINDTVLIIPPSSGG